MAFNRSLLLIVSISSLLLSTNAVPTTRSFNPFAGSPTSAPTPAASKTGSLLGMSLFKESAIVAQKVLKPKQEIIEFCTGTENPALCAETITPYFQGSSSFDPIKALETEIEATLKQSLKVVGIISKELVHPIEDGAEALDICKTQYNDIVDKIKEAKELLKQQNVVDAYYKFNGVLADRTACEDAFVESPGVDNPFLDDTFIVRQLGGNCVAIMDGIVNSHNGF